MDISVIIPIYGVEKYIEQALRSIFSQTKTEGVEFILVNDCTKDRSMVIAREVIKDFPQLKIIIIEHEKNLGQGGTRQSGTDVATGEYSIHFDPDDWVEPSMLEELYSTAKERDADIVVCDFWVNYKGKSNLREIPKPKYSDNIDFVKDLLSGGMDAYMWNKLIKRSLYLDNNLSFVAGINMYEDLLISVKLFSHVTTVAYLNRAFLHYRQNPTSIIFQASEKRIPELTALVNNLDLFLHNRGIYEQCYEELSFRKVSVKNQLLTITTSPREYASIYPESDIYIDIHPRLSSLKKLALKSAIKGDIILFKVIYKVNRLLKSFIAPIRGIK